MWEIEAPSDGLLVNIQPRGVRGRRDSSSKVVVGQRMLKRCVAAGCSNVTNLKEAFPFKNCHSTTTIVLKPREGGKNGSILFG